jgi:glycosyltransferase involved in cell wall biosynthesis
MQTLFILTKTYPFGKGEQYLDEELPFLAASFSEIILVPCSVFDKQSHARTLPANVTVFPVNLFVRRKKINERISGFFTLAAAFTNEMLFQKDGFFFWKNLRRSLGIFKQQLACATALQEFMLREKISPGQGVFYSYWMHSSSIILGILKKRRVIAKFISRAHSYDLYHQQFYPEKKDKTPLPWEYFKFKMADRVMCVSEHGRNYLGKKYPSWKNKFGTSYLGVENVAAVNPPAKENIFRIVTCSTIQELKRLYLIPGIIGELSFPVEWVHFGAGAEADIEKINAACRKHFKEEHSFLLKGFTPNEEIKKYYAAMHIDLFMNVSLAEGVPVSLMEAAGYGIPLLATDVYGNAEVARPEAGFIVPVNFRSQDATACVFKMKNDKELNEKLRTGAKEVQRKYFDAEKNFKAFASLLKTFA